jgi:solute carrier family 35 protein F1/2
MSSSIDEDAKHAFEEPRPESMKEVLMSVPTRPPIEYTSFGAFTSSLNRRFKSIWTRRFVLSLIAGQVVSLCITCTNVTTTELVLRNWALPTTQTFFL